MRGLPFLRDEETGSEIRDLPNFQPGGLWLQGLCSSIGLSNAQGRLQPFPTFTDIQTLPQLDWADLAAAHLASGLLLCRRIFSSGHLPTPLPCEKFRK